MIENYDELLRYEKKIKHELEIIKGEKNKYPKGKLRVSVNHGNPQYYRVLEDKKHGETYLSKKKEMNTIRKLAQKEYSLKLIKGMEKSIKVIERAKIAYEKVEWLNVYLGLSEERKKLVVPNKLDGDYVKEWQNATYQGKKFQDDDPEIYTEKGERVRSKSEKMIADKMNLMGIPYKYECPLKLANGIIRYTDFTVLNPKTRDIKYWEHLGKMGDIDYIIYNLKKIAEYERNDIVLGDQLILTAESASMPLSTKDINRAIEYTFLHGK